MRTSGLIVVAAVLCIGGSAHAGDPAAAEAMFQRGKVHMDAGRFAEACADFAISESLDSSVGTLLNLGECHEKLDRTASAWAAFNQASVMAEREGQLRRKDYAKERATQIEARLTRLDLRMSGERAEGLKVLRNGEDITLLVGTRVPIDPAEYVFEATAPAHKSWKESIFVTGEGLTVVVEIPALVATQVASNTGKQDNTQMSGGSSYLTQPPPQTDANPANTRRLIALGVGGVGVIGVTTGLIFGAIANSDLSKSESHCDSDDFCDQTGYDLVQDAKSAANISTALVVIGGAALIGGGVLWFTAPPPQTGARKTSRLQAVPVVGTEQVGVALTGGF